MKAIIPFYLCLLVSVSLFSQGNETIDLKKQKKTESKIAFVKFKYTSGEYEEAIEAAKVLSRNLGKNSETWSTEIIEAKLFQALSFYAVLNFEKAEATFKEASQLADNSPSFKKMENFTLLADYLQETNDLVRAHAAIDKAEANKQHDNRTVSKNNFLLVKAKVLFKQGFLNESFNLIEEQKSYRTENASAFTVSEENKEVAQEKLDFTIRKEKFAVWSNLKALCLYSKGSYKEAEDLLNNNRMWIRSNLGKSHPEYRNVIELLAKIAHNKKDFNKSASLFSDAYTATEFAEYEQNKIDDLSRMIISCIEAGQTVKYTNYLRRLEMYAFRSVGSKDRFELAFQYTESYKSYLEGDYSGALRRLNRLMDNFSYITPSHEWSVSILELKSLILKSSGDIKSYKQVFFTLSDIRKKYYGENSPVYHRTEMLRALYEIHYGKDFNLAEQILRKSYTGTLKNIISKESIENVQYLTAYAELYGKTDRYDSARIKAQEATEIASVLYNEKSPEYGIELAEYTEFQILSGMYKEGFENLEKLSQLISNYKEGEIQLLQKIHMIAARLYALKGEFDKSQTLLNKAYKLTKTGYEKQALAEAEAFEQLGSLYLLTGSYYRAEKSLTSALTIKEATLEKNVPHLISPILELARLNLLNGNYGPADQFLTRAVNLTTEVFGNKSLQHAECLLVYADYYLAIGDYKKAEEAASTADDICIKKLGKTSLKRAEVLTMLALIRSKLPNAKAADIDKLYVEASGIIKNALGTENPLYHLLAQKQSSFYISNSKSDQADQLLDKAEKFWTSKLGSDNRYSAEIEVLRGNIAYQKGTYDKAEKNYIKARTLYSNIFSSNHPSYVQTSGKLARVYFMQKNPEKSLTVLEEIIPKYLEYINNHFPSLSFSEKSKFWNSIKDEFELYNYISLCIYNSEKPKLSGKVFDNVIATKALLLSSNLKMRERIMSSQDSVLIDLYNNWVSQKEYLTNVLSFTKQQLIDQNINIKDIETDIYFLEKELSKRSEAFSGEEKKQKLNWKDIKGKLGPNEFAVEMVRLRYFNKVFTDSVIYAALIINNKTEDYPEVVLLRNGKTMEKKHLKLYRNSTIFKTKDETSFNSYWKPIQEKIPQGATVYFSSDGVYNQVNLEMLHNSEGTYVIDQNQLVYVTNTKDLLNKKEVVALKTVKGKDARKTVQQEGAYVLCGNPNFYSGTVKVREESIPSLPGAEQEVNRINILLSNTGRQPIKLTRNLVTEDTIKEIQDPKVFHIATHGYFKDEKTGSEDELANNPLLNSGLVLYGGGDILNHPENNYVNSKDGILTAYEAMNLNFDKTELVVLSACETGRGEVQVGEGVYGLQRSFLIAGADAVIMSLFKVNDEVTDKLMHSFYEKWEKSKDKRNSFIEAKREIKKQYPDPIYWGAFIMIEGKPQANQPANP